MIGNDIVDLDEARRQTNWRRNGYVEKIFTPRERLLLESSIDPEILLWQLWTMKESAYKIVNRNTGARFYAPKRFECDFTGCDGVVRHNGELYYTMTSISPTSIYTIAASGLNLFDRIQPCSHNDLIKIGDLPFSEWGGPASKTHHGSFEKCIQLIDPQARFELQE